VEHSRNRSEYRVVFDRRKFLLDDKKGKVRKALLKGEQKSKREREYTFRWIQSRIGPALRITETKGEKERHITIPHRKLPAFIEALQEKAKNIKF